MSFIDYLENKLLDHVLGPAAFTPPATVYVGLSTTVPNDDGTNFTEPAGGGYARVAVTNSPANWPAAALGQKKNAITITFPIATAPWGTILYVGIFDLAVAGNLLMVGQLTVSKAVTTDDIAQFNANTITVTLD